MTPTWLARLCSGRFHYAWVVLGLVFMSMLAGVSVRAAPGVMIGPLRRAFGWDVSTISAAISVNILLMGFTGPFMAGLMQTLGLKRTMILALLVLMSGTGLSMFMTSPWQLFLTWGVMVLSLIHIYLGQLLAGAVRLHPHAGGQGKAEAGVIIRQHRKDHDGAADRDRRLRPQILREAAATVST